MSKIRADKEEMILIGGGGHCKSCIDVIESESRFKIVGIVDLKDKLHQKIIGYEIIATDEDLPMLVKDYKNFLITIGQIRSPQLRIDKFNFLKQLSANMPVVISPHSHIAKSAIVKEGSIVMHNAIVNADAVVGKNCIINTAATIEHDTTIGDHCHISTGAIINGCCNIGERTFVGSNSVLTNSIAIAENTVINLGSVVSKSIFSAGTYYGNRKI